MRHSRPGRKLSLFTPGPTARLDFTVRQQLGRVKSKKFSLKTPPFLIRHSVLRKHAPTKAEREFSGGDRDIYGRSVSRDQSR